MKDDGYYDLIHEHSYNAYIEESMAIRTTQKSMAFIIMQERVLYDD